MRYAGSKRRFARYIVPILETEINKHPDTVFIDMFMGGANILSEVDSSSIKIGIDNNHYMISLWDHLKYYGYKDIPETISEEEYYKIKQSVVNNDKKYNPWLIGYVGTCCSYGGAWFNGYAHFNPNKNEDHIKEARNGLIKQYNNFKNMDDTIFLEMSYDEFNFRKDTDYVVYCDPPYFDTKKYMSDFDNNKFWGYVRKTSKEFPNIKFFISEYNAPDDFKCIWQMEKKDGMSTTKKGIRQNTKIEKLFVFNPQA